MDSTSKKLIQDWLDEFAQGNENAYKLLFHQYYNPLLLYGITITKHQHIVEDQIQEIFIWLYQHPQKCRSIQNLETYLFIALKKNILSSLRKETNLQNREREYTYDQNRESNGVEEKWIHSDSQKQQYHWLAKQIDQLPPRMREVVFLRYYQSLGFNEIAHIMSVTPQVAQNFALRALKKMRKSLPLLQRLLSFTLTVLFAN